MGSFISRDHSPATISDIDVLQSGRLFRYGFPNKRNNYLYVLRDYGLFQCQQPFFSVSLLGATVSSNISARTITLKLPNNDQYPQICFQTPSNYSYHQWLAAFRRVTSPSPYHVTRTVRAAGHYSTVFVGMHNAKTIVVKAVSRNKHESRAFVLSCMSRYLEGIQQEGKRVYPVGLVRCLATYHTENEVHSVMEEAGPNMEQWLAMGHAISNLQAQSIVLQLLCVLDYFHNRHIIHAGLCMTNIMVMETDANDLQVRLGGFSSACIYDDDSGQWIASHSIGQMRGEMQGVYLAPEAILRGHIGTSLDFWSLGVLTYHLLVGRPPFVGDEECDEGEAERNMITFSSMKETWERRQMLFESGNVKAESLSGDAKSFIMMLLSPYEMERQSGEDLLWHPWLYHARLPAKDMTTPSQPWWSAEGILSAAR